MCSLKSFFQGAGGRTEAAGVVVDMVQTKRESLLDPVREAMVTGLRELLVERNGGK